MSSAAHDFGYAVTKATKTELIVPAQNALKYIDGATRLMRAAVRSSDPREAELLLCVAHAWLNVAKYHLASGARLPPRADRRPPAPDNTN